MHSEVANLPRPTLRDLKRMLMALSLTLCKLWTKEVEFGLAQARLEEYQCNIVPNYPHHLPPLLLCPSFQLKDLDHPILKCKI